jgi:hypothetical protein
MYYEVLWSRFRGFDEGELMNFLPSNLRSQVSMFLYHSMITKVSLLQVSDRSYISDLISRLMPTVCVAGDLITR